MYFQIIFFNLWNTCIAIFFLDKWNKNFKYRVFENENRNKHEIFKIIQKYTGRLKKHQNGFKCRYSIPCHVQE